MRIGTAALFASPRMRSITPQPSRTGILRSRSTMPGCSSVTRASATSPFSACWTGYPASVRTSESASRKSSSSSTTRMYWPGVMVGCRRPGASPRSRAQCGARDRGDAPGRRHPTMTPGQYILVVDDDDDFREALSEVLTEAGYPVQQAENGEVALARVTDEQPGIVLLDLKMPVLDGWGVMERMRGDAKSAAVPILILSAYGFEWEAELLGAQGYIPKSVGMEEILERVRKAAGPPPMRH